MNHRKMMLGSKTESPPYEAWVYDSFLESGDELEDLIAELTGRWELDPGEDVVIWYRDRTAVALLRGTEDGPRITRFGKGVAA